MRRYATNVGVLALACAAALGLAGCGQSAEADGAVPAAAASAHPGEESASPEPSDRVDEPTPSASPSVSGSPTRKPSRGSSTGSSTGTVLEDGKHTVFITDADVEGAELTFDLVQFLTGDEADKAWQEAYPDDPEDTPPNDYFIVNSNLRLRTMPVADGVTVTLVHLQSDSNSGSEPGTFEELPEYLADSGGLAKMRDGERSGSPYEIKVADGEIVRIDERFVP